MDQVVADLLACLDNPFLAMLQWDEVFSVVEVWLISLLNPQQYPLSRLSLVHYSHLTISTELVTKKNIIECLVAGAQKHVIQLK